MKSAHEYSSRTPAAGATKVVEDRAMDCQPTVNHQALHVASAVGWAQGPRSVARNTQGGTGPI